MLSTAMSESGARGITTAVILVAAVLIVLLGQVLIARRSSDRFIAYHGRKVLRNVTVIFALLAIALTWEVFAGRGGLVIGLATAGVAFAMQEVIGAVAGWFNILSGRIFRVGDRISMASVEGDVIDVTPLRTKLMEIGGP
jgi:small-conductance mechanosensitive channel